MLGSQRLTRARLWQEIAGAGSPPLGAQRMIMEHVSNPMGTICMVVVGSLAPQTLVLDNPYNPLGNSIPTFSR